MAGDINILYAIAVVGFVMMIGGWLAVRIIDHKAKPKTRRA